MSAAAPSVGQTSLREYFEELNAEPSCGGVAVVYDKRIPDRETCVLGYQLERWAREKPDEIAIIFYGGETWSWRQTLELTRRAARGLRRERIGG